MAGPPIAAFDVDGTLTRGDCVLPFLNLVVGRSRLTMALTRALPTLAAARIDRSRRDAAKAVLIGGTLSGRPAAQVCSLGEQFAREIIEHRLRRDVVARLRWHLSEGHEVVLVTASLAPYAEPLGLALGATHVWATRLEVGEGGLLTGRLDGPNCRGVDKVRRLREHYGDEVELGWAYGDSPDDEPMLGLARTATKVDDRHLAESPA